MNRGKVKVESEVIKNQNIVLCGGDIYAPGKNSLVEGLKDKTLM